MKGKILIFSVVFALLTANMVQLKSLHIKSYVDENEYKQLYKILQKVSKNIVVKEDFSNIRDDLLLVYEYMVTNSMLEVHEDTTIQDFVDSMERIFNSGDDFNEIYNLIQVVINALNNSGVNMFCTLRCCLLDKYCSGNNILIG